MTKLVKLIPVGNSTGLILPKEVLSALGAHQGDSLSLTAIPGGVELRARDPDFDEQMAVARAVMQRRRKALRELAK